MRNIDFLLRARAAKLASGLASLCDLFSLGPDPR